MLAVSPCGNNPLPRPTRNGPTRLLGMRLPEPMLTKEDPLPTGRGRAFEAR